MDECTKHNIKKPSQNNIKENISDDEIKKKNRLSNQNNANKNIHVLGASFHFLCPFETQLLGDTAFSTESVS